MRIQLARNEGKFAVAAPVYPVGMQNVAPGTYRAVDQEGREDPVCHIWSLGFVLHKCGALKGCLKP